MHNSSSLTSTSCVSIASVPTFRRLAKWLWHYFRCSIVCRSRDALEAPRLMNIDSRLPLTVHLDMFCAPIEKDAVSDGGRVARRRLPLRWRGVGPRHGRAACKQAAVPAKARHRSSACNNGSAKTCEARIWKNRAPRMAYTLSQQGRSQMSVRRRVAMGCLRGRWHWCLRERRVSGARGARGCGVAGAVCRPQRYRWRGSR